MKNVFKLSIFLFVLGFTHATFAQVSIDTKGFKKSFTQKYDFLNEIFLELKDNKKGDFFKEVSEYYYEINKDTLAYYKVQYNVYAKTKKALDKKKHSKKDLRRIFWQKVPVANLKDVKNDFAINEGNTHSVSKKSYGITIKVNTDLEYPTSEMSIENGQIAEVENENDSSNFMIYFADKNKAESFRTKLLNLNK